MDIEITEWSSDYDRPYTLDELDTAEIPVCHTATVTERRIVVDDKTLIQNNVRTDTLALVLDGEWDGANVVILIGKTGSEVELEWKGEPVVIPSQVAENVGSIDLSVVGYSSDGTVRLVTAEASGAMTVIRSGALTGDVPAEDAQDVLAQLLESASEARYAADSADSAATAATTAAASATSAASQATSAASSATTATAKATEAASAANEAANTASSIIAQLPLPDGNVLRGTKRGDVVSVDDAYGTTPVGLRVFGKTRQNLWVNPSGTNNGVTATANADGSVTIEGTATATTYIITENVYSLKPSTTYSGSVEPLDENISFEIVEFGADGSAIGYDNPNITFTTKSNLAYSYFRAYVKEGVEVSGTYKIMLNEGSTAEPWCPPGIHGVGELELTIAGKNLWQDFSSGKVTAIDGGGIQIGVSDANWANGNQYKLRLKKGDQVTLSKSGNYPLGTAVGPGVFLYDAYGNRIDGGQFYVYNTTTSKTITVPDDVFFAISYFNGVTTASGVAYVQLELGSVATDYEPPMTPTLTPVDLKGEVLYDLPDGTADELVIDSSGAASVDSELYLFEPESCNYATEIEGGIRAQIDKVTMPGIPSSTALFSSHFYWDFDWAKIGGFTCNNAAGNLYFQLPTSEVTSLDKQGVDEWIAKNRPKFLMHRPTPTTTPLDSVPLPTLPSPNATLWDAGTHPGEVEMEYVRDVNVVIGKLEGAM